LFANSLHVLVPNSLTSFAVMHHITARSRHVFSYNSTAGLLMSLRPFSTDAWSVNINGEKAKKSCA